MKRLSIFAAAAALSLLLAGCGDDSEAAKADKDDQAATSASTDEAGPLECADFAGETMTDDFEGCTEAGELQAALVYDDCQDGRSLIVSGPAYGWVGEPITYDAAGGGVDGEGFKKLWNECYGY
jgi:hypothetical protein